MTRDFDTRILATGSTYESISPLKNKGSIGHAEFTELDPIKVRGKEEVKVYMLKSLPEQEARVLGRL